MYFIEEERILAQMDYTSDSSDSDDVSGASTSSSEDGPSHAEEDSLAETPHRDTPFNYQLFWIINSVAIFILIFCFIWCCRKRGSDFVNNWTQARTNGPMSDLWYATGVIRRREEEMEKKKDSPEERRQKLVASFQRNKVKAIVKEDDFVSTPPGDYDLESGAVSPSYEPNADVNLDSDSDSGAPISLNLPLGPPGVTREIPNCCAVCLCPYEAGDEVVWSSNTECQHVFHEECIIEWLIKMQNGTPCPCCRREFTDLPPIGEEEKPDPTVVRIPHRTFNMSRISLR